MNTENYLMSAWNWSPTVIALCAGLSIAYFVAPAFRARIKAGYFFAALALFFLTLCSPLNQLADGFLFSAHMLQHMLLLLIVPLLLLLSLRGSVDDKPTAGASRWPALLGWLGGVSAMWIWHERTLCDLAIRTELGRTTQIVSLLVLGALFWRPLFGPRNRASISPLAGVVYLFSACFACSVLGIMITFAPGGSVCPVYMQPPNQPALLNLIRNDWGFSMLRDQQVGGLLMWIPGCGIYLSATMAMLARWYRSDDARKEKAHVGYAAR
jgi:cytochrome c oxidase assembly factor CtaG